MIKALNKFLLEQLAAGNNAVLIIDESQNLRNNILEEVRLLSNLETEKDKLFQIVLVGQPELKEKLESPDLAQLKQRISIRYHLKPLEQSDVSSYVNHRLKVAGLEEPGSIFTDGALDELYIYSKGVPRLLNIACDRSMLLGYVQELKQLNRSIVKKATSEIEGIKI